MSCRPRQSTRFQFGVHLPNEPIGSHSDFLHLRIEIGRELGGNDFVFALALGQQSRDAIADGQRNVAVRDNRGAIDRRSRSEEHTSELQSRRDLVCRLLLEKKNLYYFLTFLL